MYEWRKLTELQREKILASRQASHRPWHTPPHFETEGISSFHLTAACYEHQPIIGNVQFRMQIFEEDPVEVLTAENRIVYAWCVLPNHWHALLRTGDLKNMIKDVAQLHGRTSYKWNREDSVQGRKCRHGCSDRRIRSDRHFYATRNYIHHNPVKHGYVGKWEEWPYSSATDFMLEVERDAVLQEWTNYPVLDMGSGWDD